MKLLSHHIHAAPVEVRHIGGIHLPESVRQIQTYRLWTVLQTGPGRLTRKGVRIPVECEAGDRLVTQHNFAAPHELSDGTVILTPDQVLAVIPQSTDWSKSFSP